LIWADRYANARLRNGVFRPLIKESTSAGSSLGFLPEELP